MIIDQAEVVMGKHFTTPQWKNGKIMHQSRVTNTAIVHKLIHPRIWTNMPVDHFRGRYEDDHEGRLSCKCSTVGILETTLGVDLSGC